MFDMFSEPPEKPVDCSIRNDSSAMEVNCLPGSSGGLPQHFLLEVRGILGSSSLPQQIPQSDQTAADEAPAVLEDRNDQPSFQLYGLLPGYDYTIAVYAENSQGRSLPVLIENIRVTEPLHKKVAESKFLGDISAIMTRTNGLENAFIVLGLVSEYQSLDFSLPFSA
jgi:hypothetical protein